jgi:hypothetical protein
MAHCRACGGGGGAERDCAFARTPALLARAFTALGSDVAHAPPHADETRAWAEIARHAASPLGLALTPGEVIAAAMRAAPGALRPRTAAARLATVARTDARFVPLALLVPE